MNKPTINISLETRRVMTTGPHVGKSHIKLWVTFIIYEDGKKVWKQRPYQTGLYCTPEEFALIRDSNKKQVKTYIKDIRERLTAFEAKANHIIINLNVTSQQAFEALFLSQYRIESVAGHFDAKIKELDRRKKISSSEKYTTALRSFQSFPELGPDFTFDMCTPEVMQAYEDWYISQSRGKSVSKKKSLTSVGINCRCLRHIFKRAIAQGITNNYPFGIGKYVIPEGGDDTKKFLSDEDKTAFVEWRHDNDRYNELHDYVLFSYYAFGINISDIARLRRNKVHADHIEIDRQKTKGRKKKKKVGIIPMHPVMQEIINRRQKHSLIPDDYIFPILDYKMDEEAIFYEIRYIVDRINEVLKLISEQKNFALRPTSYTLRHTFAFNFMQLGATTEDLQDALIHGSIKTSENYKHGFRLEKKKKFSDGL